MHRYITIIIVCLGLWLPSIAQNKTELVIGEWRINYLIDKEVSNREKSKRYIISYDSLYLVDNGTIVRGEYSWNSSVDTITWWTDVVHFPINIHVVEVNDTSMKLIERSTNNDSIIVVMVRINEEAIYLYEQAKLFEKQQLFIDAYALMNEAARLDLPEAMYDLGMYYLSGIGVATDEIKGSQWIRKAAAVGHAQAISILASNSLKY